MVPPYVGTYIGTCPFVSTCTIHYASVQKKDHVAVHQPAASNKKARKSIEISASIEERATEKYRGAIMSQSESGGSISDVVTHLQNLLQTKEKELKEREADFDRRVKTFESTHPSIGGDNDVIQLNVGGRTDIAVIRNTLTQFEDSMLAAKFSGRWDDSMEKDRDGNIFIDQDPENFMILINFLRTRMNNRLKLVPNLYRPTPTYNFCTMLEYYNLIPGVYPQTWVGATPDSFTVEEITYGTMMLSTKEGEYVSVVHPYRYMLTPEMREFTVDFDKGSSGAVGWVSVKDEGRATSTTFSNDSIIQSLKNSLFLNVTERKIYGPKIDVMPPTANILGENLRMNHNDATTKVILQRRKKDFSIEVDDNAKVSVMIPDDKYNSVLPMIYFSGKVTISGVKYAIDEIN